MIQPQAAGMAQMHLQGKTCSPTGRAEQECLPQLSHAPRLRHLPRQADIWLKQVMLISFDSIFCFPSSPCKSQACQHDMLSICKHVQCLKHAVSPSRQLIASLSGCLDMLERNKISMPSLWPHMCKLAGMATSMTQNQMHDSPMNVST